MWPVAPFVEVTIGQTVLVGPPKRVWIACCSSGYDVVVAEVVVERVAFGVFAVIRGATVVLVLLVAILLVLDSCCSCWYCYPCRSCHHCCDCYFSFVGLSLLSLCVCNYVYVH